MNTKPDIRTGIGVKRFYLKEGLRALHTLLLLMPVMPLVYLWASERSSLVLCRLFLGGCLFMLPVVFSRIAAGKLRSLWSNLLADSLILLVTGLLALALGKRLFPENMNTVYAGGIVILSLLPVFSAIGRRSAAQDRVRARMEQDLSWRPPASIAREPHFLWLIWFVMLYLSGLVMESPQMCDLMLGLTFAYLIITAVYLHISRCDQYLEELHHVSRIPADRIHRGGLRVVLALLMVMAVMFFVSFFTRQFRRYADIRDWHVDLEYSEDPFMGGPGLPPENDLFMQELYELMSKDNGPPPVWLSCIANAIAIATLILFLRACLRALRSHAGSFREGFQENGDEIIRLEEENEDGKPLFLQRSGRRRLPEDSIRREYRRAIRRRRRQLPLPCETPAEIEQAAGLDDPALHARYEKARYADASAKHIS